MYLNQLGREQKELFRELCVHLSMSDNDFCEQEKSVIDQLCQEMQITIDYSEKDSFDSIIEKLNSISNEKEKRIILLELAGVVMADNVYAESEKEIMIKLSEKFQIEYSQILEIINLVSELYCIYSKFANFIKIEQ